MGSRRQFLRQQAQGCVDGGRTNDVPTVRFDSEALHRISSGTAYGHEPPPLFVSFSKSSLNSCCVIDWLFCCLTS